MPIGLARHRARRPATSRTCGPRASSRSTRSACCWPASASAGLAFGALGRWGSTILPLAGRAGADRRRRGRDARLCAACAARRRRRCSISRCCSCRPFRASVVGGFLFRLGIGAMPFLLPLLLQLGFGLTAVPIRADHLLGGGRRHGHEDACVRCILRRFGFRCVLIVNALIERGASSPPARPFTPAMPFA